MNQANIKKETTVVPFDWRGLQYQLIRSIISIVFVLIDEIGSVNCINHIDRIDPGVLNYSALQLNDNSNDLTNSGINFWGKTRKFYEVTGIYWYFQIFHVS